MTKSTILSHRFPDFDEPSGVLDDPLAANSASEGFLTNLAACPGEDLSELRSHRHGVPSQMLVRQAQALYMFVWGQTFDL